MIAYKEKLNDELNQAHQAGNFDLNNAVLGTKEDMYANILTKKLADRSHNLKDVKRNYDQQIKRIASIKTGLTTMSAKLGSNMTLRRMNRTYAPKRIIKNDQNDIKQ